MEQDIRSMQSKTTFKDIGNYIVYTDGRVWSKYSENWIKPRVFKQRYIRVKIDNKRIPLHRLVAQCFISNPLNHPEVDHRNNNKEDNRVENLQWISGFDNRSKAHRDGLIPYHRDTTGRFKKALNKSQGNTQNAR